MEYYECRSNTLKWNILDVRILTACETELLPLGLLCYIDTTFFSCISYEKRISTIVGETFETLPRVQTLCRPLVFLGGKGFGG